MHDEYRAGLWPLPAQTRSASDETRRVGVEIEFSGLSISDIANMLQDEIGGRINQHSRYESGLEDSELGDFGIELDFAYLKNLGRERDPELQIESMEDLAESMLELLARQVVPYEIVSPPVPMDQLWRLNDILTRLRQAGARGTSYAASYAFGVHLNPELPDLETDTIVRYLQAFLCLTPWLQERSKINLSRRLTPYIDPFGTHYAKQVCAPDYRPDQKCLIDDYLTANPTRNRALDMLPLFAHLDKPRVFAAVDDDRIKARPTFHYRMPNCQIDDPHWNLTQPWRDWLQVEALASSPGRLDEVRARYVEELQKPTGSLFSDWIGELTEWLIPELM